MLPKDWVDLLVSVIIGGIALYGACTSKSVEKNIKKLIDLQSYNGSRKKIIKDLNDCVTCITESTPLGLTNISKIQSTIHRLRQYPNIFNKSEKKTMQLIIDTLEVEEYTDSERGLLLNRMNSLKAKLEKGDVFI